MCVCMGVCVCVCVFQLARPQAHKGLLLALCIELVSFNQNKGYHGMWPRTAHALYGAAGCSCS